MSGRGPSHHPSRGIYWKAHYIRFLRKVYAETECVCGSFDPEEWIEIPSARRSGSESHVSSCVVYYAYQKLVRLRQAEIARKQKSLNPRDVAILGGDPSL